MINICNQEYFFPGHVNIYKNVSFQSKKYFY